MSQIQPKAGGLFIGATVTMTSLIESEEVRALYPALAEAAGRVGSVQVRNLATLGGNSCNAAPSADTVPPLIVYKAEAVISGSAERRCPLEDFFTGPGKSVLKNGEILKGFQLPPPAEFSAAAFVKHSRRPGMDLATVAVASGLSLDSQGGQVAGLRVVLGAVGPTPILVKGLNLTGRSLDNWPPLIKEVCEQAILEARPITDVRGSREYRLAMVGESTAACLEEVIKKLRFANSSSN